MQLHTDYRTLIHRCLYTCIIQYMYMDDNIMHAGYTQTQNTLDRMYGAHMAHTRHCASTVPRYTPPPSTDMRYASVVSSHRFCAGAVAGDPDRGAAAWQDRAALRVADGERLAAQRHTQQALGHRQQQQRPLVATEAAEKHCNHGRQHALRG